MLCMNRPDYTLYFITDSTGRDDGDLLRAVDGACRGGAGIVQLREKDKSGGEYLRLARLVKEVTDRYGVPLIIDDRIDVALASGAAGVHVGSSDIPVADARKLMGEGKIVGATAKTVEAAMAAQAAGADYIGCGAIYPTSTKVVTVLTEVKTLCEITKKVDIPVCAIGGLNRENCDVLRGSGIAGICVVSAIMKSEDRERAARELYEKASELVRS